jgi:hypothetical protein
MIFIKLTDLLPAKAKPFKTNFVPLLGKEKKGSFDNQSSVFDVGCVIKNSLKTCFVQFASYFAVLFEQRAQGNFTIRFPNFHRAALNNPVGIFAGKSVLGQGEQNPLGENQAASTFQIGSHSFRINQKGFQ